MKKALITGVNGQDGAYLAERLLKNGYEVTGTYRKAGESLFWRLQERDVLNHPAFSLAELDLTSLDDCIKVISLEEPDLLFNLASRSSVALSFKEPVPAAAVNGMGAIHILEAIRITNPEIRFCQASSSDIFGAAINDSPLTEDSPLLPRSPYAVSKLFAHWATVNYRESYGIFSCCGILFNHESPLRGKEFVTRKVASAVAEIHLGKRDFLSVGNMDVFRDWGYAPEYIEALDKMLHLSSPEDLIIATGEPQSLREFIETAFLTVGKRLDWKGEGVDERGYDEASGRMLVKVDPAFFRPGDINRAFGSSAKASRLIGWQAETKLEGLCKIMVEADISRIEKGFPF